MARSIETTEVSADPLELRRLGVVGATILLNIIAVALFTLLPWSNWRTGLALNLFDDVLFVAFIIRFRDCFLARLCVFGWVVGITELAADAWLVDSTRTLDYSIGGGPMLWRSPIWMPLAWQVVAVQFGCLGLWLLDRFRNGGLAIIGLLGAINIPYYEEMAKRIHWWQYRDCRMISFTPLYIIVGEFIIAIALAVLARSVQRGSWLGILGAGVAGGIGIFAAYAVAFLLTDGLWRH